MTEAGTAVEAAGEAAGEAVQGAAVAGAQAVENAAEGAASAAEGTVTTQTVTIARPAEAATGTEAATATPMMAGERAVLRRPAVEREGFAAAEPAQLTADELTGTRVYGVGDEDVGEIGDLVMSPDGARVEGAVLDVGGFLGIGERRVAVTLDEIQFLRGEDGALRAYVDASKEELEAQPAYGG